MAAGVDASTRVCAVLVAYFPDAGLDAKLQRLSPQLGGLVVIDNTPKPLRLRDINLPPGVMHAKVIENKDNLGVATALNQGLAQAMEWGFSWIVTLDQDSECHVDMVSSLLEVARQGPHGPLIVGGNYFDRRNRRTRIPVGRSGEYVQEKTAITSGCLFQADFARRIGGFRDDYFIDQLDHEFCLRARSHGAQVLVSRKLVMDHSVGEDGGIQLPILGRLPMHAPVRKYYIARNSITTVARHWRHEPDWCVRRMLRLFGGAVLMLLLEPRRSLKLKAFLLGVADGLRGRMGPCPHDGLNKQ